MLGQGVCDVPAVVGLLSDTPRFNGWLVVEEESADPAAAVARSRGAMRAFGL